MNDSNTIRVHSISNEAESTPRMIVDRRTPGTEAIATPPWLVDIDEDSDDGCGRGRSTTRYPPECRRRIQTESASYHVSARHRTSTARSRRTSSRSSTLLASERMLRNPNARRREEVPDDDDRRTSSNERGRGQLIERRLIRGAVTTNAPFPVGLSL